MPSFPYGYVGPGVPVSAAELATALAAALSGREITIVSPVDVEDGNRLTLYQGDDHLAGDRLPTWTITGYAGPSLSGATAVLRLLTASRYNRSGTHAGAQLEVAATLGVAGSTVTVTAPITAAQSALLASNPPADDDTHTYHVVATTSAGKIVTLLLGPARVTRRIEPAE